MTKMNKIAVTITAIVMLLSFTLAATISAKELDGAKVYRDNCTKCHSERSPMEKTDAEWKVTITHMRTVAGMTAAESRSVLKFLTENNGE